ncbi:MAG: anti-sigma factor antagonist [Firmicutes bacterium]|nr:anti-sigma factor antagonist [Bacillota bacterium]
MMVKKENDKIIISGRVDSSNAKEFEEKLTQCTQEGADVKIDAAKLEYISSAGLRVFLKIKKSIKGEVLIENVSGEVYDIFEVTGFTNLLNVKKAYRNVSIDGLEKIGSGVSSQVYRLDNETIIKVFKEAVDIKAIERENEKAKNAFLYGIPTAISYDIVKVGGNYGAIYEMLDAKDLNERILEDKEHLDDYIEAFAKTIKKMHETKVDPKKFDDLGEYTLSKIDMFPKELFTEEEKEKFKNIIKSIPQRDTFVHGDCHIGNVMLQGNEHMFIDLETSGKGHPIYDLEGMYRMFARGDRIKKSKNPHVLALGYTVEEMRHIWEVFAHAYFDDKDEEFIKKAEMTLEIFTPLRMLVLRLGMPFIFDDDVARHLKNYAFKLYDEGKWELLF